MKKIKRLYGENVIWLACIFLIAFALRVWGITFGLPHIQHIDENKTIYTSFYMASHMGKPDEFSYGTIFQMILALFISGYYLFGKLVGWFADPQSFLVSYVKDPSVVVVLGRSIDVASSLATILLIYFVGKMLYNRRIGLIAALFLAVSVLHVKESHYVKQDVLTGLITLVTVLFSYLIAVRGLLRYYVSTGIAIGIGLSVKYHFALVLPTVIACHYVYWRTKKKFSWRSFLFNRFFFCLLLSCFVSFFFFNPYALFDAKYFLRDFFITLSYGKVTSSLPHTPLWNYVFVYLKEGLGIGIWGMASVGLVMGIFSKKRLVTMILASFPLVFLLSVNVWSVTHHQRYAVPTVPFVVLLAAYGTERVLQRFSSLRRELRYSLYAIVLAVLLWQPLFRSIQFDFAITRRQTGDEATVWIEKHIPPGSKIVLEWMNLSYQYPSFGPYLSPDKNQLQDEVKKAEHLENRGAYIKAVAKAFANKPGYRIIPTLAINTEYDENSGTVRNLTTVDPYVKRGVDVLVAYSWSQKARPWTKTFTDSLQKYYKSVVRFTPTRDFNGDLHVGWFDYRVLDSVNVFDSNAIFGQEITVYQRI